MLHFYMTDKRRDQRLFLKSREIHYNYS